MTDKSRRRPSKTHQSQRNAGLLNKRVDGLTQTVKSFQKATVEEFQAVRQEMADEFQAVRQEMKQGFESVREETKQALEHQGNALQKQIHALAGQIAENEQRDAQFRNSMLTAVDLVMKQYELFQQEKAALGAGQDRLQKEVDHLKEADSRQNEELRGLNERVTRLEAA